MALWARAARLALLCALCGILAWPAAVRAADTQILFRSGDLLLKPEKGEAKPLPPEQDTVPAGQTLEAGAPVEPKHEADLVKAPPKSVAAVAFSPRELVTLATGGAVLRAAKDPAKPEYRLKGPVHLLIYGKLDGKDAPPLTLTINGAPIEVQEAHLFFDGWKTPARLTVLSGAITVPAEEDVPEEAADASAASASATDEPGTPAAAEPDEAGKAGAAAAPPGPANAAPAAAAGPLKVGPGQTLLLYETPRLATKEQGEAARIAWSTVAGFDAPGAYKRVGHAVPSDEKVALKRNGHEAHLTGKRIPVMEGDEVLVPPGQKTELQLDSKDKIALTGEARFKVEAFAARSATPSFLFSIFGKVRAVIAPKDPGAMQFRTATATIGVKGTDFEAIASAANTDVSVLEGKVGVGDASGAGEVDVPAGFSTSVGAGLKPTAPKPLPPERLKELRSEGPGPTALNISAPTEAQVLAGGKAEWTAEPPSVSVEVLLDDKPLEIKSGAALPELPDGAHKLTVRGTAAGALSKTVTFTVDRKPPALDPAIAIAALTLTEGAPPLVLKWNKPLASAEATYGGKTFPLTLSPDGLTAPLALDPLTLKEGAAPFTVKATDKAGNSVTSEGTLTFRKKPTVPPKLTASHPEATWHTNAPVDLKVTADRDVASWEVMLGTINLTERVMPRPAAGKVPEARPPREITVTGRFMGALADGDYPLSVKATDRDGLTGEFQTLLQLDRTAPIPKLKNLKDGAVTAVSLKGAPAATLKAGGYEVSTDEPLKELRVQLDGHEFKVSLAETRDKFFLFAEPPGLGPGEHTYRLGLTDVLGNARTVDLKVVVESPKAAGAPGAAAATQAPLPATPLADREGSLRRAYEHTLAGDTQSLLDLIYLGERGDFVYVSTPAPPGSGTGSGTAVYRQGKSNPVSKDVDDPLVRATQEP